MTLSLFTHRDCIALVTPVIDEEKLQALDTVPYSQLREEFRDQVSHLASPQPPRLLPRLNF